jgi:hypothetical protein
VIVRRRTDSLAWANLKCNVKAVRAAVCRVDYHTDLTLAPAPMHTDQH